MLFIYERTLRERSEKAAEEAAPEVVVDDEVAAAPEAAPKATATVNDENAPPALRNQFRG